MSNKVFQIITDKIIEKLEAGTVPWHRPWKPGEAPKNLISGNAYNGVNAFLLSLTGFESNFWLTFKQAKQLDAQVRAGEKSLPVVFWKFFEDEETEKKSCMFRYYRVFNVEQCDRIDPDLIKGMEEKNVFDWNPIDRCDFVVDQMWKRPEIKNGGDRACYSPVLDFVQMPKSKFFESAESYYNTLFHELAHSTGHESRLKRDLSGHFGDHKYSQEELIAEMTAAFLCAHCGIEQETIDNSAAYIQNWLSAIKRSNPRFVIDAAQRAQKAFDFIVGKVAAQKESEAA